MIMENAKCNLPDWLVWAREIQAIAQTGNYYAINDFQRERYSRLHDIAAEMFANNSNLRTNNLSFEFISQVGYATPKVDVRGALFKEDKILLVRELLDNCWTMPGGWADVGESPSQAVEREVFEETGLSVQATKIIGVYDANRSNEIPLPVFHAYKMIFLCKELSGTIGPTNETSEAFFFSLEEIPEELSKNRTQLRHIQDAFTTFKDPCFQAVFD